MVHWQTKVDEYRKFINVTGLGIWIKSELETTLLHWDLFCQSVTRLTFLSIINDVPDVGLNCLNSNLSISVSIMMNF